MRSIHVACTAPIVTALAAALFAVPPAQARRGTSEDIGYVIENSSTDIKGRSDGTYSIDEKVTIRILSPIGAERAGLQRIYFNAATQTLKLNEAYTQNGKQRIDVDRANIETRSIAASGAGFDDQKQMQIPFPQLKAGARLSYRYMIDVHTPALAGVLQGRDGFRNYAWIENLEATYDMPSDVRVEAMDPRRHLRSSRRKLPGGRTLHRFTARNLPANYVLGEEDRAPNDREYIWVDFSSLGDWGDVARRLAPEYEKILAEPLPAKFADIAARVKEQFKGQPIDQAVPAMWEAFIREVRYFGDWRTVKGAYIPRALATIADSGYGDCKDFSVLMARGLRALGLEAWPALVERGNDATPEGRLPVLAAFNHAITLLRLNNKDYFVDGTNPVPNFGVIPDDISDRPMLPLADARARLERVPAEDPKLTGWTSRSWLDAQAAPEKRMRAELRLFGAEAWDYQNWLFGKTEGQVRDAFLGFLRIPQGTVKDFRFLEARHERWPFVTELRAEITQDFGIRRAGDLLVFPLDVIGDLTAIMNASTTDNRITSLRLDEPATKRLELTIPRSSGIEAVGNPRECSFKTPWFTFHRHVTHGEEWVVEDTYTNARGRITPEELSSKIFRAMQARARECSLKVDAVFRRSVAGQQDAP